MRIATNGQNNRDEEQPLEPDPTTPDETEVGQDDNAEPPEATPHLIIEALRKEETKDFRISSKETEGDE